MTDPWANPPPSQPQPQQPYGGPYGGQQSAPYGGYGAPPPYQPPPKRGFNKWILGVAIGVGVLFLGLFAIGVVTGIKEAAQESTTDVRQQRVAEEALDKALAGPADTDKVKPAKDGSRRYQSPSPDSSRHAFNLTLPKGWEGRHVGARSDSSSYYDSVINSPTYPVGLLIRRVDFGAGTGSRAMQRIVHDGLDDDDPPATAKGAFYELEFGDGESGYALDATIPEHDDEEEQHLRVIVFDHAGETFRLDIFADRDEWKTSWPRIKRILDTWRWG